VKSGGVLVMVDDDSDPYNKVREWWNGEGKTTVIPRRHLFDAIGVQDSAFTGSAPVDVEKGAVIWLRESPVPFALSAEADARLAAVLKQAAEKAGLTWQESNHLILRRGPWIVAAGLNESVVGPSAQFRGRYVSLFDPDLKLQREITLMPGQRLLLRDLGNDKPAAPALLASACKALPAQSPAGSAAWTVEGVGDTPAIVLIGCPAAPKVISLAGQPLTTFTWDAAEQLLHIRFPNESAPRVLSVTF
jgi:hypothetical protein